MTQDLNTIKTTDRRGYASGVDQTPGEWVMWIRNIGQRARGIRAAWIVRKLEPVVRSEFMGRQCWDFEWALRSRWARQSQFWDQNLGGGMLAAANHSCEIRIYGNTVWDFEGSRASMEIRFGGAGLLQMNSPMGKRYAALSGGKVSDLDPVANFHSN